MNRFNLLTSLLALIFSLSTFFYFKTSTEIAYVDINKLMEGYKRTKIVRTEFEQKSKSLNANIDSLLNDWQREIKSYEKQRSRMSKKELELKHELLSNKQQQINNYQQAIQKQIEEEDKKGTQIVINDINDYVKSFGNKNGYKIIFGATGSGNIMYASEKKDITTEVLEGLNAEFDSQ